MKPVLLRLKFFYGVLLLFFILSGAFHESSAQGFEEFYIRTHADIYAKNDSSAIGNISKALQIKPGNAGLLITRGECYYRIGNFTGAFADFLKADSLVPGCASFQTARCLAMLENFKDAVRFISKNIDSKYKKPQRIFKTETAFEKLSKAKEWQAFWKENHYTDLENSIAEAEYYIESGKFEKSLALSDDLLIKHKNNNILRHARAKSLAALGETGESEKEYSALIRDKPNQADYYIERAGLYTSLNRHKKALADLNKALELDPLNYGILKLRALTEKNSGMPDEAINDYQKYLAYYTTDNEAIYQCGLAYFDKQDYQGALPFFNKLLEKGKNNNRYFVARGNTYLACRSYSFAEIDFTQALDLDPGSGITYLNRGMARFEQGFLSGACRDWGKARDMKAGEAAVLFEKHCMPVNQMK